MKPSRFSRYFRQAVNILLLPILIFIAVFEALSRDPMDYAIYVNAARDWSRIYTASVPGFYYLPWSLAIMRPLSLLPLRTGWVLFNVAAVIATWLMLSWLCPDPIGRTAAIARLPFILVLSLGQWEWLVGVAVLVAEWALQEDRPIVLGLALALLMAKPNTVVIAALYFAVRLARRPLRFQVRTLLPPVGIALMSFAVWGWWIPGYWRFTQLHPAPVTQDVMLITVNANYPASLRVSDLARIQFVLAWLLVLYRLRRHPPQVLTVFSLVFGAVLWPHAVLYNYASSAPAIAWLFAEHRRLGMIAVIAELAAMIALLLGGVTWLLPLVWLLVGATVAMSGPNLADAGANSAEVGVLWSP